MTRSKLDHAQKLARAEASARLAETRLRAQAAKAQSRLLRLASGNVPGHGGNERRTGWHQPSALYGSYDAARRSRLRPRGGWGGGDDPDVAGGGAGALRLGTAAPAAHLDAISQDAIVADCQHAARNDPLVRAILQCCVSMIVGKGLTLDCKVKAVDADGSAADPASPEAQKAAQWKRDAEKLWWEFCTNTYAYDEENDYGGGVGCIDVRGQMDDVALADAIVIAMMTDGDGFLRRVNERGGSTQWIEGQRVQSPRGRSAPPNVTADGGEIVGVEVDKYGRPIGLHVADWTSDLSRLRTTGQAATTLYKASEGFWLTNPIGGSRRFNTVRGEPGLACVISRLEHLASFKLAVLEAQRIAACFGAIRRSANPGAMQQAFSGQTVNIGGGGVDGTPTQVRYTDIAPGMIMDIGLDGDITTLNPSQPSTQYQQFVLGEMMEISASVGVPIALALMDPRQTNYSSLRSMMAMAFRGFSRWQIMLAQVFSGLYRWKVRQWIDAGLLSARDDADAHDWILPPVVVLDPEREITAIERGVNSLLFTRKQALAQLHGIDMTEHFAQIAEEQELMDKLDIAQPTTPGAAQAPAPDETGRQDETARAGSEDGDGRENSTDAGSNA